MEKTYVLRRWDNNKPIFAFKCSSFKMCCEVAVIFMKDLSWADLSWADLSKADLRLADLSKADLRWADLSKANLSEADLSGADLDFSTGFTWSCKSLKKKIDKRIAAQMLYHAASDLLVSDVDDHDIKELLKNKHFQNICNSFHRVGECGRLF